MVIYPRIGLIMTALSYCWIDNHPHNEYNNPACTKAQLGLSNGDFPQAIAILVEQHGHESVDDGCILFYR